MALSSLGLHLLAVASTPLLAPVCAEESQALEYLGTGYNIIIGDPHTVRDRDPGWQRDIISRSYLKEEWVKSDGRCSYDASNFQITGAKSAQKSMKSEWNTKTSVGLFKIIQASFTASSSVQEMDKPSRSYGFTYFETRAECHLKTATLPAPSVKYDFTSDFEAAVKAIPTDASTQWVIDNFIGYFGTHYTDTICSGGLMGKRSWMSKQSFDSLWLQSGHCHTTNDDATTAFQEAIQSGGSSSFCIGCSTFVPGDAEKWGDQVKDNLEPIGSSSNLLVAISELLIPIHFPNADAQVLKLQKATVERALEALCTAYKKEGCTTNPKDRLDIPPRTILEGSWVESVQWSPDGGTLASGTGDQLVRLWDAVTGRLLRSLPGHTDLVYSVAYSPDGTHILSGSNDKTIRVWDAVNGTCLQTLTGHNDSVNSVGYSPDGTHILSGSYDETVKVWDAVTGTCLQTLTGHTDPVKSVAYSPDGTHILSGSNDKTIRVWDAVTGKCLQTLTGHTNAVKSVAYSPDGTHILSGSWDQTLKIWDAVTGNCLQTLTGHTYLVTSVGYSPDGTHILSGSGDETIKVWDAVSGICLQTLTGHTYLVTSVGYSPDGAHILSGSEDKTIRVWDAPAKLLQTFV
ncbi:HET-E1 [Symbiodinium necroappetens]|uniref:HET-E1 protein n=1 Tax=Symbiodinium necroappetens TaxID=1628268 RepID=A0A812ISR8_9DINO|nr:HET-E1 [Symbiodinium necroappetens]